MKYKFTLFLAVLLSSGLFAFARATLTNTTADQPQPTPSSHPLEFDSIQMIDRRTGWAQNAGAVFLTNGWVFKDKSVWRTTDGGKSWAQGLVRERG
jgi:hypothetical protein